MKHRYQAAWIVLLAAIVVASTVLAWASPVTAAEVAAWEQLEAGESRWYSFEYAGDRSQIEVRLEAVPAGSVSFQVWTPDQVSRLQDGDRVQPIGRGSEDSLADGVLSWSGSFPIAGTYAVTVERSANATGTMSYALTVTGSGVTFAGASPATTTQPAKTQTTKSTQAVLHSDLSGKLLFETSYGGALYTINADGTGLTRVGAGIDASWSPDGTQIAYVSWQDPRGVWVMNADGSNARRVFDWTETRYPSWSPDGQDIVFSRASSSGGGGGGGGFRPASGDADDGRRGPPPGGAPGSGSAGRWTLGIVSSSDGTFSEPQPASDTNLTPDWSPDGERIVFTGYRGLMVQSVDGKESWQLTTDPRDTSPVWSPDGTKVAYAHRQHDHWEIYVIDVTTGRQTKLTTTPIGSTASSPASSVSPAWSPDGQQIAFLTNREGRWNIWAMNADGSQPSPMFGTELDSLTLSYAFSGERALDWVQ